MTDTTMDTRSHRVTGPPLLGPAIVYAVLTILAVAVPPLMAGERPWASDSALLDFYAHHGAAAHAGAFFTFGAAIPLAVFTAVSTTRLRTLGFDVAGRIIALVGGVGAAAMLAVAGLTELALTQSHVAESAATVRGLNGLVFALGGPGFVVFAGLLLAGVSVVGLIGGALPRPLAWFGLVVAVISELATLAVAFSDLSFLLPIGRFGGLIWIIAVGALLPATRRDPRFGKGHG